MLSPMALLERLARLVPQAGQHMTRYFGVLASAAEWRARIIPKPLAKSTLPLLRRPGRRLDWANLLRRVFLTEVLACACGGTRRVIATIEEGLAARTILRHLGLPDTVSSPTPARLDHVELWLTGPSAEHHRDLLAVDDVQRSFLDFAA